MATIFARIALDSSEVEKGLTRAKKRMDGFKAAAMKVGGALGIAFGGRAIISGLSKFADELDRTAKMAKRLGTDAETLQRMAHAAELSGTNLETVTNAMTSLTRRASDFTNTTIVKAFESLNIAQKEFAEMSPDQQMKALADGFRSATDRGEAFRALQTLLEEQFRNLIPLLEEGGEGIQELMDGASVATNEAAAAAENLNDQWAIMKNTAVPLLGELLVGVNKLVSAYKTLGAVLGGEEFNNAAARNFFGVDPNEEFWAAQNKKAEEEAKRTRMKNGTFAPYSEAGFKNSGVGKGSTDLFGAFYEDLKMKASSGNAIGRALGFMNMAVAAGTKMQAPVNGSPAQAAADSMAAIGGGGNVNSAAMRTARIQQDQLSELKEVASNTEAIAQRQGEIAMR